MRNVLIVLSGPSGVGKGTIAKMLVERNQNIALSISCTTRAPRVGESHGKEYFFVSSDEFRRTIKEDGFLEYSEHFENCYGTPKKFVVDKLTCNDVLLEIDVNGGLAVKQNYPEAVLIMLLPPSIEEVRRRLKKRSTETDEKIEMRLSRIEYELEKQKFYDYTVVNGDLETAYRDVLEIINKEKNS